MRTFNKNQNQKAQKTRGAARGRKKQTSFLTALVKNAKKPKRNEAKERIEKRTSKKHIRKKKLTTSKWQRSVHKFLKSPQQANVKPKYHKKKLKRNVREETNLMKCNQKCILRGLH